MTETKKIGIWMDHARASLMDYTDGSIETKTMESALTHDDNVETQHRSEKTMHNKEQHQESGYYKSLGEVIKRYDDVLLFGPTDANVELFNVLRADRQFEKITIHLQKADKMTEPQQHAFVKAYFSRGQTDAHHSHD